MVPSSFNGRCCNEQTSGAITLSTGDVAFGASRPALCVHWGLLILFKLVHVSGGELSIESGSGNVVVMMTAGEVEFVAVLLDQCS